MQVNEPYQFLINLTRLLLFKNTQTVINIVENAFNFPVTVIDLKMKFINEKCAYFGLIEP